MNDDFLVFGSPLIEQPEIDEVVDSLKSGWLGPGPKVEKFELMLKELKQAQNAVLLNSATAALHLSLIMLNLKPGDEVIVPSMTFAATANAVIHAGGIPVFTDCQRDGMNIDPDDVERKRTSKTKAIIPVHFAGRPCDMDVLIDLAARYNLRVVEDCAHALESEYKGKKAGTMGDFGCFSFYVTKNITTGEGGAVITSSKSCAERIRKLASHGLSHNAWRRFKDGGYRHYLVEAPGYKYAMTDIQASIGIHQLPRIYEYLDRRREIWDRYGAEFADLPVFVPAPPAPDTVHALHLYTLLLDEKNTSVTRDEFLQKMNEKRIGVGVHYDAAHLHPFYRKTFGYKKGALPNTEWISQRTVSIPLSPKLTDNDVDRIVESVRSILG